MILTDDEVANLVTVVGGKLTPHLSLGTEALFGRTLPPSTTTHEPLPGAVSGSPGEIDRAAEEALAHGDAARRHRVADRGGRAAARRLRHAVP